MGELGLFLGKNNKGDSFLDKGSLIQLVSNLGLKELVTFVDTFIGNTCHYLRPVLGVISLDWGCHAGGLERADVSKRGVDDGNQR